MAQNRFLVFETGFASDGSPCLPVAARFLSLDEEEASRPCIVTTIALAIVPIMLPPRFTAGQPVKHCLQHAMQMKRELGP